MSTWTDDQHTTYANARLAWFEANQKSWICPCGRVVEYAPEMAGDPCDHTAYCSWCVRDWVADATDERFYEPEFVRTPIVAVLGIPCPCADEGDPDILPHDLRINGPGAQSYAAHVAAGTLR